MFITFDQLSTGFLILSAQDAPLDLQQFVRRSALSWWQDQIQFERCLSFGFPGYAMHFVIGTATNSHTQKRMETKSIQVRCGSYLSLFPIRHSY